MATNEILRFAQTDTTTNLLTQAEYDADAQRLIGNQPGVARSKLVNKALRQSSLISAGVAQFIAEYQANNVTDGLTPANISDYLEAAIQAMPVAAGTAAAPSIAPTGDTDTGLYFPAANQVAISTGGAQRVVVDASGNVGVGVNPSSAPSGTSIQFGPPASGLLFCDSNNTNLASNAYFDTTWKYQTTGVGSSRFTQTSGSYGWYSAPAGTAGSTIPFGDPKMTLDASGAFILLGSAAQKASGTTWSNPSDARLKRNIAPYKKGIAELMQVQVKTWVYNGKGGTVDGTNGIGLIADEAMLVLPDTVETYKAKLNKEDELETDIKKLDATEITWLLVNAVQQQQALIEKQQSLIESLTARIAVMEAK